MIFKNKYNIIHCRPLMVAVILLMLPLFLNNLMAQLSPGDLAKAHSHLEGISNCTKCHILGNKVSNDKCLDCHKHLNSRIKQNKGYHSSGDVSGKSCTECHSDHHGRNFQMIRFETESFDHSLTGYLLEGSHKKQTCNSCHKSDHITNSEIKKRKYTYLGLSTECLTCHTDYHQKTLSSDCEQCHDFKKFRPATRFNHDKASYSLAGKHKTIECLKCHKISSLNGREYQQFKGIKYGSCADCHKDVHDGKFGKNCKSCHTEESFQNIISINSFDHNKTSFKLEGKHLAVKCTDCHKGKLTDPLRHKRCDDCHRDYHEGEFKRADHYPDCSDCHNNMGFEESSFSIERHNNTRFPLREAHMATPCFVCHKKSEKWKFMNIGLYCVDCHKNIHELFISKKYYPDFDCRYCHKEKRWSDIEFDHNKTGYELLGKHKEQSCRDCHFYKKNNNTIKQRFEELDSGCLQCHKDEHYKQFDKEGECNCLACHDYTNWKANKFDHDKTRFPLDGEHKNVPCTSCHYKKQEGNISYTFYKINKLKCEDCH